VSRAIHFNSNLEELSRSAAADLSERMAGCLRDRGSCSLILSGGRTPTRLYEILGSEYAGVVDWRRVHFFWSDERWVPADDARSNYHLARAALLDRIAVPPANLHPMPTDASDPKTAARRYERTLVQSFESESPRFDLLLLGLGTEGHTASIFPGSPALTEARSLVMAVTVPVAPPARLTFTLAAINRAHEVHFLVAGAEKAEALRLALSPDTPAARCPAAGVRPRGGHVHWWVDASAASRQPKAIG
jgi:6-phosphogluconolactonase